MEEDKSDKSLPADQTENEPNRRQVSFSLGDCTANHQRSFEGSVDAVLVTRSQSVPNNSIQRTHSASAENNDATWLIDDLEASACGPSRTPLPSCFSLRLQSEFINIPSRSNLTIRNRIRFQQDECQHRHKLAESQSTLTSPPSIEANATAINENSNNAELIVLHGENISFNSSESLIAKDSMGQSLVRLAPKTSGVAAPCTSQPPPYHVATANDTASVQITPAATSPMVLYSAPPLMGAPPTYSALLRIGPQEPVQNPGIFSRRDVEIQPSAPFIAPPPPPTYAQAQGFCVSHPLQYIDIHDSVWGPEPITIICPHCNNYVITSIHFRRSNMTHYSALALCICGCWPCCLLPYCMQRCKCAYHECPICANVVGIYSPWQVS